MKKEKIQTMIIVLGQNYRSGKYELENMSFKVAKKLIRYSEELKMRN